MLKICTKCLIPGAISLARKGRRLPLDVKIDPKTLEYNPVFKPAEYVNGGISSRVYDVEGYPNLVIRISHCLEKYCPLKLKRANNPITGTIASGYNEEITVMKKLSGSPLYGKRWDSRDTPDIDEFRRTLTMLSDLPDSAFEKYIDDVAKIRENGYKLDLVNPNNLLIDFEKGEINICDLSKGHNFKNYPNAGDFYPFLDAERLFQLMENSTVAERQEITRGVQSFFDRIKEIGKRKGLDLRVEAEDENKLQDFIVHVYNGAVKENQFKLKDKITKNMTPKKGFLEKIKGLYEINKKKAGL
ncbi:hypothetical protein IJ596_04905 [bacterium]|nr:hypothetical protein [bacterium]